MINGKHKHRQSSLVVLMIMILSMASCGKGTPEKAGENLGEQRCACERVDQDEDLRYLKAVLGALEADPAITEEEAYTKVRDTHDADPSAKDADKERREQEKECKRHFTVTNRSVPFQFTDRT